MGYLPPAPQFVAFLVVAGLLTITPGADMALGMRHALGSGRREAWFASLGICLGCLTWETMSALDIAAVLARSAAAFTVLKYRMLLTDSVTRRIEAVTGAVLLGLGVRLALARR